MNERTDYVGPVTARLQGNPAPTRSCLLAEATERLLSGGPPSPFYFTTVHPRVPPLASVAPEPVTEVVSDAAVRQKADSPLQRPCSPKFSTLRHPPSPALRPLRGYVSADGMNIEVAGRFLGILGIAVDSVACRVVRWF